MEATIRLIRIKRLRFGFGFGFGYDVVKENSSNVANIEVVKGSVVPSVTGDCGNAAMEVVLSSVVDEIGSKERQSPVVTSLGSYPPLPMQEATLASNAPDVDLLKEDVGNVPVRVKIHGVPITAFSEDGLSVTALKLGLVEEQLMVELLYFVVLLGLIWEHFVDTLQKN
ncbi:hypothetical protein Tco_0663161 [Tanacetum coccineum]